MELASILVFVLCLKGVQVREIFSLHERKGLDHALEKDRATNSAIYAYDVEHERDHLNVHVFVNFEGRNALSNPESLWKDKRIPYELSEKYDAEEKSTILAAMDEFKNKTCLRFEPREGEETPFILIEPGSGCSATVGRTKKGRMSISDGCYSKGIILHELMHVLGFLHEHSRPDRDDFVNINWQNIQEDFKGNFEKNSLDEVEDGNITYDYGSLMHYAENNFAKNRSVPTIIALQDNVTIGQREAFSEKDIERIWVRYGCGKESKANKNKSTRNTAMPSTQKTTEVQKSSKASKNTRKTSSMSTTTRKTTQSATTSSSTATVNTQNTPSQSISTETPPFPESKMTSGVQKSSTKTIKSTPSQSTAPFSETLSVQESTRVSPSQSIFTEKATTLTPKETSRVQKSSTSSATTSKLIAGLQKPVQLKRGIKSLLRYLVTTIYREGNGKILPRLINIFTKRTTQQGAGFSRRRKRNVESKDDVESPAIVEHKLIEVDSPIVLERRKDDEVQTADLGDFRSNNTTAGTTASGSNTPMHTSAATVGSETQRALSDRILPELTTAGITIPDHKTNSEKDTSATRDATPRMSTSTDISTESENSKEVNPGTKNLEEDISSSVSTIENLNPISPKTGNSFNTLTTMDSIVVTLNTSTIPIPEDFIETTDDEKNVVITADKHDDSTIGTPEDSSVAVSVDSTVGRNIDSTIVKPDSTVVVPTTSTIPIPEDFIEANAGEKNVVITTDSSMLSSEDDTVDKHDNSTIGTAEDSIVAENVDSTVDKHENSSIAIPEVAIVAFDESVHSAFDSVLIAAEDSTVAEIADVETRALPFEIEVQHVKPEEHFHIISTFGIEERTAVRDKIKHWPGGIVPYELSNKYDATQRRSLLEGIEEFTKKTCVTFRKREEETTFIFIEPEERCKAPVGRQPGKNTVTLSEGCYLLATILHELMHVLGFIHEQNRPDRDAYVTIQWDNILEAAKPNFIKSEENEVTTLGVGYDYDSVMHYSANEFAKDPAKPTIVPLKAGIKLIDEKEGFSRKDILKINKLYNCPKKREISGRRQEDEKRVEDLLLQKLLKYFELNFQRLFRSILRTIQRFRPNH